MATVTQPEPQAPPVPATVPALEISIPTDLRFVLHGISWATYKALGDDLERGGSRVRITYDNGRMELRMPGPIHERYSRTIVNLMSILSEEVEISILPTGSTTHQREDLGKAFEPDESFYIRNERRMLGRETLDLPADPPADLTVEIDITRDSRNRLHIFAAVGVPEVWRFDGETITVHVLQENGEYIVAPSSLNFPWLPLSDIVRFIKLSFTMDRLDWLKAVRNWLRREVVPHVRADA